VSGPEHTSEPAFPDFILEIEIVFFTNKLVERRGDFCENSDQIFVVRDFLC
jgi:hypothetical protein